jgi:ABC-type dipeptide/oligopeptide/nickel transport system permease component
MIDYIGRRVLQVIPVILGTTLILFALQYMMPGADPIRLLTGDRAMSPVLHKQLEHKYNLDKPLAQRYLLYLEGLAHGDFGTSYKKGRKVLDILGDTYPNSVRLAFAAIALEAVIGLGAGIISAVKRYTFLDALVTLSTSILVAIPVFWLGLMLQIWFGLDLKILPVSGMGDGSWPYYVLPSITLAAVSAAYVARLMRSQMIEVMRQDYVRTAAAKGLSQQQVVWRHALKNALIPVVTFIGLDLGALMGGAILTESVFNWPGVGYEIYLAITQRDYPVVLGGVLILVLVFIAVNLLVDISYAFLDPRIRLGGGGAADI